MRCPLIGKALIVLLIVLVVGSVVAAMVTAVKRDLARIEATPSGWTCTADITPNARCSVYLLTAPDGQTFLVSYQGGIIPYTPQSEKKP